MFYAAADFVMLNAIDFGWFVTLTLWHCVTPQQRFDWFTTARECDILEFNFLHVVSFA